MLGKLLGCTFPSTVTHRLDYDITSELRMPASATEQNEISSSSESSASVPGTYPYTRDYSTTKRFEKAFRRYITETFFGIAYVDSDLKVGNRPTLTYCNSIHTYCRYANGDRVLRNPELIWTIGPGCGYMTPEGEVIREPCVVAED